MSNHPNDILIESLVLWALVFYLAMAVAMLAGLASWWLGGHETVLKTSWVLWCAGIALVPLAARLLVRSQRRGTCGRDATWITGWLKHSRMRPSYTERVQHPQIKQRQHARSYVQYPARIATEQGTSSFAMIADLSLNGCRIKSKTTVAPGDFGKLLINVPIAITPVTVSLTSVRWVNGQECGLEFILMDLTEQGCLNRCLNRMQSQVDPVAQSCNDLRAKKHLGRLHYHK
jgi:hypothetical protein